MAEGNGGEGTSWPSVEYDVGREKIREFVDAVGERRAIYHDREAAREAGFRDLVAPPMFAVVYAGKAVWPAILDPDVGIDLKRMLHVGQQFEWGDPVCAGDVVTTDTQLVDVSDKGKGTMYTFATSSRNQDDQDVARGMWTLMVR